MRIAKSVLILLIYSCGSDASAPDGANLVSEINGRYCDALFDQSCTDAPDASRRAQARAYYQTPEACKSGLEHSRAAEELVVLTELIEIGRVAYDQQLVRDCLVAEIECPLLDTVPDFRAVARACRYRHNGLLPTVEDGGLCVHNLECMSGACGFGAELVCGGLCRPTKQIAVGDDCAASPGDEALQLCDSDPLAQACYPVATGRRCELRRSRVEIEVGQQCPTDHVPEQVSSVGDLPATTYFCPGGYCPSPRDVCTLFAELGDSCATTQCNPSLVCRDGTCHEPVIQPLTLLAMGVDCTAAFASHGPLVCEKGSSCDPMTGGRRLCVPNSMSTIERCTAINPLDARCVEGEVCSNDACVPKKSVGTSCFLDAECIGGICSDTCKSVIQCEDSTS